MKFSYNWIREFVEGLETPAADLERLITMKTAECEGIEASGVHRSADLRQEPDVDARGPLCSEPHRISLPQHRLTRRVARRRASTATDDNIGQTTTMSISNAQPAPLRAIVQGRINPITAKPRIHALHAVYKMRALLTPREVVRA